MEKVASTGALFLLMYLGERAQSHAVLPAFLLGLARARTFERRRVEQQRFRVLLPLPSRGAGEIGRCALAQQDERFVDGPARPRTSWRSQSETSTSLICPSPV
jgi:hypothetical protein